MGFAQRFETMGDRSEKVFDDWAKHNGINQDRWGINRPPFSFVKYLPREIRWSPDRICEDTKGYVKRTYHANVQKHFFVEVKAVGRDQIAKIKKKPLDEWLRQQDHFRRPVLIFIFDSHCQRVSISHTVDDIVNLAPDMKEKEFRDGTPYFEFPTETFIWEPWKERT